MTVGQTTTSTFPLQQLAVPAIQPWAPISDPKVIGAGAWSATSAACWYYGRGLTDALKIPIGLVSSNWGGTIIQSWASNETNTACGITEGSANSTLPAGAKNEALSFVTPGFEERVAAGPDPNHGYGVLYNAMIAPFALGPMTLSSMIWFQGESNNGQDALYECMQPAMIEQWRNDFDNAAAFFGFVVMEPWIGGPAPDFRLAQLAALTLPYVGYGTATDAGDPTGPDGSIHACTTHTHTAHTRIPAGRPASLASHPPLPCPQPRTAPQQEAHRWAPRSRGALAAVRHHEALEEPLAPQGRRLGEWRHGVRHRDLQRPALRLDARRG